MELLDQAKSQNLSEVITPADDGQNRQSTKKIQKKSSKRTGSNGNLESTEGAPPVAAATTTNDKSDSDDSKRNSSGKNFYKPAALRHARESAALHLPITPGENFLRDRLKYSDDKMSILAETLHRKATESARSAGSRSGSRDRSRGSSRGPGSRNGSRRPSLTRESAAQGQPGNNNN